MSTTRTLDVARWGESTLSWRWRVAGIYVGSRLLAVGVFFWTWYVGVPDGMGRGEVGFSTLLARAWDGRWYAEIAEQGYPSELPTSSDGDVEQNAWAFFPLYPALCRAVMSVSGLPWEIAGPAVSMACGLLAVMVLHVLVREAAPALTARRPFLPYAAVAGVSMFPSAGAFSMAYSDSLALLLLTISLLLIVRQRYLLAVLPVAALGMTRAIALPLVAVVLWQLVCRVREHGSWRALPVQQAVRALVLIVTAGAAGFAWPVLTGLALGAPDAYFATQGAWRSGPSSTVPFAGWVGPIETWVGWTGFVAFVVVIVAGTFTRFVMSLGPILQAWGGAYAGYLVAASVLSPSTPRYFLLGLPLQIATVGWARSRSGVICSVLVLTALQAVWIVAIMSIDGWTP